MIGTERDDHGVFLSVESNVDSETVSRFKDAFYHYNDAHGFCWDKNFDLKTHKLPSVRREFENEISKLCGAKDIFLHRKILRDGEDSPSLRWAYSLFMLVLLKSVYEENFSDGIADDIRKEFWEFIDTRYFQIITGKTHVVTAISVFLFEKMNKMSVLSTKERI